MVGVMRKPLTLTLTRGNEAEELPVALRSIYSWLHQCGADIGGDTQHYTPAVRHSVYCAEVASALRDAIYAAEDAPNHEARALEGKQ
jgi:hypothetical protein